MNVRNLFVALTMVITIALGMQSFAADSAAKAKLGEKAPEFTLKDQNGKDVSLADFAGKIVVLEWFNEQCPFVVKHYKGGQMNSVAARYKSQDVVWLAVNSTAAANVESNLKIAGEWKIDRPILDDSAGKVGHAYGATNTPHMYIVGKDGTLAYKGAIDSDSGQNFDSNATNYVAKALDDLLQGKPVSQNETKAYGCSVKYAK